MGKINDISAGEAISAANLNAAFSEARKVQTIKGANGIQVKNFSNGIYISGDITQNVFKGIIVDTPSSESPYTDCRYYVQTANLSNDESDAEDALVSIAATDPADYDYFIYTVTNLSEINPDDPTTGSHNLKIGQPVIFFEEYDSGSPPTYRYYMEVGGVGGSGANVKIIATADGGGIYTGVVWDNPTVDIDPTVDLTEAIIGTSGVECIIVNLNEAGAIGIHLLDVSGSYLPLIFAGVLIYTNSDGTPVYSINGHQYELCTPAGDS